MKCRLRIHLFYSVVLLVVLLPLQAGAQISEKLYRLLPDSLRPADRRHLTFPEARRILFNAFYVNELGREQYGETDSLCHLLAPQYYRIKDDLQRLEFLRAVCVYLFNSYGNYTNNKSTLVGEHSPYQSPHAAPGLKYCNIFLEEYSRRPLGNPRSVVGMLYYQAHFHLELDNFKDAYNTLQRVRQLCEAQKWEQMQAYAYNSLSYLFQVLSLTEQSLAYEDSASLFAKSFAKGDHGDDIFRLSILQTRQQLFFDMLTKTGRRQFVDSIYQIHKHIIDQKVEQARLSESSSFVSVALANYYERRYTNALANIDSAFAIRPDFQYTSMGEEAIATKGFALMKSGRNVEGIRTLQLLRFNVSTGSIVLEALEELYKYEIQNGNYQKALEYLNLQLRMKERQHALDLQGRALEIEQVYNAKAKEDQITYLKQLHTRNGLISLFAITSILLLLAFIILRYRASHVRTRDLIKRIDDVMQMQVSQIETAVDAERKLIGQQLHDDLSASMGATFAYLRVTADEKTNIKEKEHVLAISKMLEESYHKARGKSHELYLEKDSADFWDRFSEQVGLLFSGTNIKFTLHGDLSGTILSPELKTALVMIVKEAITNLVRHSRATRAEILLYDDLDSVVVEVSDNGRGFSTAKVENRAGLKSIRDRVERLGGTVKWSSERNKGVVMTVRIAVGPVG